MLLLSHWLWEDWFGGDPSVLGRSMEVSGSLMSVIGVMGPDFRFPNERSLARRLPDRFGGGPRYAQLIEEYRPIVRSLEDQLVGDIASPLWILVGTVGIVLLIACANVANLLIVRAESRRRDLAVRRALGAGRPALVRSLMAEAILLAALGGIGGAVLAWGGIPFLVRAAPQSIAGLSSVGLHASGLAFTAGVAILAATVTGLLPALRFSNPGLVSGLREPDPTGSRRARLTRDGLVVV